jgi:SAM-dependent methyltransferase
VTGVQEESQYWEAVGRSWQDARRAELWRAGTDALHARLLARWRPHDPVEYLLKTDLFDEAVSDGLYPLLSTWALRFVGIDVAGQTVRAARDRYPEALGAGADVRRLPFQDATFGVIVSNSTLDHLAGPGEMSAALRELFRVLRPEGQLWLTLDNPVNPVVALRNRLPFGVTHRLGLVPYRMGWTCGPRRLGRMLREAGFEIDCIEAFMHCPRAPAVALASVVARTRFRTPFLLGLLACERLARWPTRFLSGYFTAVKARKPGRPRT